MEIKGFGHNGLWQQNQSNFIWTSSTEYLSVKNTEMINELAIFYLREMVCYHSTIVSLRILQREMIYI